MTSLLSRIAFPSSCLPPHLSDFAAALFPKREHKKKMTEVRQAVASLLACQQASLVEQAKLAAVSALASLSHKSAM